MARVVYGRRASGDGRDGTDRVDPRIELLLVGDRDRAWLRVRHLLHGLPFDPGATAGPAPDDPIPAAIRLSRRDSRLRGGARHLCRLQRLQPLARGRYGPLAERRTGSCGAGAVCLGRVGPVGGRARLDPYGPAGTRLRHDRGAAGLHDRYCATALCARSALCRGVPDCAVPGAILRRGSISIELVDLCLGLFSLSSTRRRRSRVVSVDVSGCATRRRLDDARGRGRGRGRFSHGRRIGDPGGRKCDPARLRPRSADRSVAGGF